MKAILPLKEMPKSCADCALFKEILDSDRVSYYRCVLNENSVIRKNKRLEWCPLKPMPESMFEIIGDDIPDHTSYDWNVRLEELEK